MRSIELFSGTGTLTLLTLGLEQVGFKTVAPHRRNAEACATLFINRQNWQVIEGDVCNSLTTLKAQP